MADPPTTHSHTPRHEYTGSDKPTLNALLQRLKIPAELGKYDQIVEESMLAQLERWKEQAIDTLRSLRTFVRDRKQEVDGDNGESGQAKSGTRTWLDIEEHANIIFTIIPFTQDIDDGDEYMEWSSPQMNRITQDILMSLPLSNLNLTQHILTHILKPLFQTNPHPQLSTTTGRALRAPGGVTQRGGETSAGYAGGPDASQDFYEGQIWKETPGIGSVVCWCVAQIDTDAYEQMWPLLVPPIMTLLDDFEPRYKLCGVHSVRELLQRVPPQLLKRTGLQGLLRKSLTTCLTHLERTETPRLLRAAIKTSLTLTLCCTVSGSAERFDQLATILGEGIIGGVWLYAEDKPEAIRATLETLPDVIRALGVGSARFLKQLIPQLMHPLVPRPFVRPDVHMQLATLRVLGVLIDECAPRMESWRTTIIDGVGKCWVDWKDAELGIGRVEVQAESSTKQTFPEDLKSEMQNVCMKLATVCPSLVQDEYMKLLSIDQDMFGDLIIRVPVTCPR